jgi:anti-sigma B factor antagonist
MGELSLQETESASDPPVVKLVGEIDLAVAPSLREHLELVLASGQATVVVDLLEATFLDSIALGVLVGSLEACKNEGGTLRLVVTEPRILKVLEITGLIETFPIHSTVEQATAADAK